MGTLFALSSWQVINWLVSSMKSARKLQCIIIARDAAGWLPDNGLLTADLIIMEVIGNN
jgi:hypothetical protein